MSEQTDLSKQYGSFYSESPHVTFDPSNVPPQLRPLIPYATFWGISDDIERERLAEKAPQTVRDELKQLIVQYDDFLDEWLAGDEAMNAAPSDAYIAFSAMRMCADYM